MAVNAAVIAPHHFVSVLMCSGLNSGKVFAVPESDLIHRRKKLDIGAHVLVKQHDGSRRRKGVIVHMNPHINARVPPAAPLPAAAPAARPPRQRPVKRPREPEQPNPAVGGAAKRYKPGPSQPVTLPGYLFQPPVLPPVMVQYGPIDMAFVSLLQPPAGQLPPPEQHRRPPARPAVSRRYPGRGRVRKRLTYSRKSSVRSIYAPLTEEELDGIVQLASLDDFDVDELATFAEMLASDNHIEPLEQPQPALPPTTLFPDDRPLRPAPFSRSLLADHPQFSEVRNEQRSLHRDLLEEMGDTVRSLGSGRCCSLDCLLMSPRLG